MSDLESAVTLAPIISAATGKLRSLSGHAGRFGDTDALVDAFAEVFAQMAIAAPPPIESSDLNPDASQEDSKVVEPSNDSENQDQENTDDSSPQANATVVSNSLSISESPDKLDIEIDSSEVSKAETDDTADELTTDTSKQSQAQLPLQETVAGDVNAPTVETESDSQPIAESQVVATTLRDEPERRSRRESNAVIQQEAEVQRTARIGDDATAKAVQTQSHSAAENQDQSSDQQQSWKPAEQTTRQEFLDQRRSNPRDNGLVEHQSRDSQGSRSGEQSVEKRSLAEATNSPAQVAAPTPTQGRPTPARATIVDPNQSLTQAATAKTTGTSGIGRTETRTPAQSIQPETENRFDNSKGREARPVADNASSLAVRVKLVQRVSRAFQHLGADGGVIRLRLAPAELGSVRVEMQIKERKVEARVVAETEAASAALKEHLPDLRARLESYGMQVETLEVETESHDPQSGLPFDRESQQRESEQRQPRGALKSNQQEATSDRLRPAGFPTATLNPKLASRSVDLRL